MVDIKLPVAVITKSDLSMMLRELENLDAYLEQARIRGQGAKDLPPVNKTLDDLATVNNVQLLEQAGRGELKSALQALQGSAPLVHISFAARPEPQFLAKLIVWFRKEIHPGILLQVGLQPSIAAGCTIRTTNKYFDLSLRQYLVKQQPKLQEKLHEASK